MFVSKYRPQQPTSISLSTVEKSLKIEETRMTTSIKAKLMKSDDQHWQI